MDSVYRWWKRTDQPASFPWATSCRVYASSQWEIASAKNFHNRAIIPREIFGREKIAGKGEDWKTLLFLQWKHIATTAHGMQRTGTTSFQRVKIERADSVRCIRYPPTKMTFEFPGCYGIPRDICQKSGNNNFALVEVGRRGRRCNVIQMFHAKREAYGHLSCNILN